MRNSPPKATQDSPARRLDLFEELWDEDITWLSRVAVFTSRHDLVSYRNRYRSQVAGEYLYVAADGEPLQRYDEWLRDQRGTWAGGA